MRMFRGGASPIGRSRGSKDVPNLDFPAFKRRARGGSVAPPVHLHLSPRPQLSHVVFDFDGTLSWLRHGWPEMMCDAFCAAWPSGEGMRGRLLDEVMVLNGKPSIFQCQRLAEIARGGDGMELDAAELRDAFQRRLDVVIAERSGAIRSGAVAPGDFLIAGAGAFLKCVARAGLVSAILSSTAQERVREEAALLGIAHFFGPHIYGGTGDPARFSKRTAFEQFLREEGISGDRLLSFGDGPVEIRDTKALGGVAIGVCTDEAVNGSGIVDPRKRAGLVAAGADGILPDFRDAQPLLETLLDRAA